LALTREEYERARERALASGFGKSLLTVKKEPPTKKTLENLLTAEQVGEILNVPKGHVYELARKRILPFIFVGKKYKRFRPQDLHAMLDINQQKRLDFNLSSTYSKFYERGRNKKNSKKVGIDPKKIGRGIGNSPKQFSKAGTKRNGYSGASH